MRNRGQEVLESNISDEDASTCINHCLSCLYADKEHDVDDEVVKLLTYEKLILSLLEAKNEIFWLEETLANAQEY